MQAKLEANRRINIEHLSARQRPEATFVALLKGGTEGTHFLGLSKQYSGGGVCSMPSDNASLKQPISRSA